MIETIGLTPPPLTWLLARDGSLSAADAEGRWLAGCSLPYRAAQAMLKSLAIHGTTAGFLAPPHAGHLRVALEMTRPAQAIVAIVPDPADVNHILRCEDFSSPIAAGRLWFACGADWPAALSRLFDANPGLPTPSQFVRLPLLDDEATAALVEPAQKVFAAVLARRADRIRALRETPVRPASKGRRKICVVAGSQFRLWDDAGALLHDSLISCSSVSQSTPGSAGWDLALAAEPGPEGPGVANPLEVAVSPHRTSPASVTLTRVDPDLPACAGPLALAEAAAASDAIVCANAARADLPDLASDALPWITWVTADRIPSFASAGPRDALMLADASLSSKAIGAGWPAERVAVSGWPARPNGAKLLAAGPAYIALIADTAELAPPSRLDEFSSHRLLWETVRRHLQADPFAVGNDAAEYLERQTKKHGVAGDELDRQLFIDRLIHPAFAQGLARALQSAGVPLRAFGLGWDALPEFAAIAGGPIGARDELHRAIDASAALIHPLPGGPVHMIASHDLPILRAGGPRAAGNAKAMIAAARRAIGNNAPSRPANRPHAFGATLIALMAQAIAADARDDQVVQTACCRGSPK